VKHAVSLLACCIPQCQSGVAPQKLQASHRHLQESMKERQIKFVGGSLTAGRIVARRKLEGRMGSWVRWPPHTAGIGPAAFSSASSQPYRIKGPRKDSPSGFALSQGIVSRQLPGGCRAHCGDPGRDGGPVASQDVTRRGGLAAHHAPGAPPPCPGFEGI